MQPAFSERIKLAKVVKFYGPAGTFLDMIKISRYFAGLILFYSLIQTRAGEDKA